MSTNNHDNDVYININSDDYESSTYSLDDNDTITLSNVALTGITVPWTTGTGISMESGWNNHISSKIKLDGENADIEINGESLVGMLKNIQERMNILTVNTKLESEWEELRLLGEQYRALEKHILAKQATWDRLKAMPPPEID